MREIRNHEIDGWTYVIQQLGAKQGRIVLARVLRVVAGAAGAASAAEGEEDGGAALAAIGKLSESLSDSEIDFLCDTFAKTTRIARDGKEILLSDGSNFDDHFAGRYGAMMKWLWAALETNFSSFLTDMGLDVGALAETVKTAMKTATSSPTAPSGASSSPASGS
jgi:hypothetical protein